MLQQLIFGKKGSLSKYPIRGGTNAVRHSHPGEVYSKVLSEATHFIWEGEQEYLVTPDEISVILCDASHSIVLLKNVVLPDFFAPMHEDRLQERDHYLRP